MTSRTTGLRVGVVATPAVALGYRAAGFRPRVADSVEEAEKRLAELGAEGGWGVVLVQEDLLGDSGWSPITGGGELPIVVPFPGAAPDRPPDEASAYVTELLRRAVGYRVRLR